MSSHTALAAAYLPACSSVKTVPYFFRTSCLCLDARCFASSKHFSNASSSSADDNFAALSAYASAFSDSLLSIAFPISRHVKKYFVSNAWTENIVAELLFYLLARSNNRCTAALLCPSSSLAPSIPLADMGSSKT